MGPTDTRKFDESDLILQSSGVIFQRNVDGLIERLGCGPNVDGGKVRSLN